MTNPATNPIWCIHAQIVRWVSDDQPGFVECRFTDRFGREWSFVDKVPVLTNADIRSDTALPQPAFIGCQIIARGRDDAGRETVDVTTQTPWGIESTDGTTSFPIFAHQLTETAK